MRRIGRLVAVAVVIAGVLFDGAAAAADPGAPSLDEVYAQVGSEVDRASGDVIVMIDVSADMDATRYAAVKQSLTGYFRGLAPVDQVTLIPYAGTAMTVATQRVGQTPDELVNLLPPAPLPGRPNLEAAVDSALTTLHRPGRPGLATVLLLTAGPAEADWRALKVRARGLWHTIDAYVVPLETLAAPQLTKVFPRATVLPPTTTAQLPAALGRARERARQIKARNLLGADLEKPLRVTWPLYGGIPHGTSITEVEVRSTLRFVPLTLDQVQVTSDNPDVTVSVPPGPWALAPGEKLLLPVTAHWDAGPRRVWPFFTVNGRAQLDLTAYVATPWEQVLDQELKLRLSTTLPYQPIDRDLSAQRGSYWFWLSGIVLLAALAELVVWWWRHPPERRRKNRTVTVAGTSFTWQEDETGQPLSHAGSA